MRRKPKPSKEELEMKCKELGYNATKVGICYEISSSTACRWMKEYKIEIKNPKTGSLENTIRTYVGA